MRTKTKSPQTNGIVERFQYRVKEGLHRRLAEAPSPLLRPILVVALDPGIEIGLEFDDRSIDLLAEGDAVELIEQGLVGAVCGSAARTDLCGGRSVTSVPTDRSAPGDGSRLLVR
jgi:hypothetical protein